MVLNFRYSQIYNFRLLILDFRLLKLCVYLNADETGSLCENADLCGFLFLKFHRDTPSFSEIRKDFNWNVRFDYAQRDKREN